MTKIQKYPEGKVLWEFFAKVCELKANPLKSVILCMRGTKANSSLFF